MHGVHPTTQLLQESKHCSEFRTAFLHNNIFFVCWRSTTQYRHIFKIHINALRMMIAGDNTVQIYNMRKCMHNEVNAKFVNNINSSKSELQKLEYNKIVRYLKLHSISYIHTTPYNSIQLHTTPYNSIQYNRNTLWFNISI